MTEDLSTNPRIEIRRSLAEKVHPSRVALVIIDMQNDLLHAEGKAAVGGGRDTTAAWAIVPPLQRLLFKARDASVLVIHVQATTLLQQASGSGPWLDSRSRATFSTPDICVDGTWGQQTIEELAPSGAEPIVKKYRYSAFPGTSLDLILRSNQIETVITAGVSTNACVEATAREAFSLDYYVIYPADCVASWSKHLHDATLETAAHRYAIVCPSSEIMQEWKSA